MKWGLGINHKFLPPKEWSVFLNERACSAITEELIGGDTALLCCVLGSWPQALHNAHTLHRCFTVSSASSETRNFILLAVGNVENPSLIIISAIWWPQKLDIHWLVCIYSFSHGIEAAVPEAQWWTPPSCVGMMYTMHLGTHAELWFVLRLTLPLTATWSLQNQIPNSPLGTLLGIFYMRVMVYSTPWAGFGGFWFLLSAGKHCKYNTSSMLRLHVIPAIQHIWINDTTVC